MALLLSWLYTLLAAVPDRGRRGSGALNVDQEAVGDSALCRSLLATGKSVLAGSGCKHVLKGTFRCDACMPRLLGEGDIESNTSE